MNGTIHLVLLLTMTLILSTEEVNLKKKKLKSRKELPEPEQLAWRREFENELSSAVVQSRQPDVLDKFVQSIEDSHVKLENIQGIDFRLNRLDMEVHDKTDKILNYLKEILNNLKSTTLANKLENNISIIKKDVTKLKNCDLRKYNEVDANDIEKSESNLNNRMRSIEDSLKSLVEGFETISSTISEDHNQKIFRSREKMSYTCNESDIQSFMVELRKSMLEQNYKKCECRSGPVGRSERYPTDCSEIQMQGFNVTGIYKIMPDNCDSFNVLCDLDTAGGRWTVFQNRYDGSQNFYKPWYEYKYGFGNLAGEFWMGLEKLHQLTGQKLYELRVELETADGHRGLAGYSVFGVGSELEGYRISTLGNYYGTAGDALSYHAGQKFSTYDVDNDEWDMGACAVEHSGAWWYKECHKSNLNGKYMMHAKGSTKAKSMYWVTYRDTALLTRSRMLIRPLPPSRPSGADNKEEQHISRPAHHYRYDHILDTDAYLLDV